MGWFPTSSLFPETHLSNFPSNPFSIFIALLSTAKEIAVWDLDHTDNITCFPRPYPGAKLVRDKSPIAWGHKVVLTSSWNELPKCQWCRSLSVPIQSECVSHPQQTSKANVMPATLVQNLTQQSNILCTQDSIESISWKEIKYAGRQAGFLSFHPSTIPLWKVVTLMGLHLRLAAFSLTLGEQWQPRCSGQGGGEEAGAAKGGRLF